jgi:CRISPR/Cas system CSM-associated protein Csm3 (group 7 of RAMP superfamily)
MIQLDALPNTPLVAPSSLRLTAIVDTALCVGAGGSSGSLADKPIVRNARGQLFIPGSQLKGRLRHECEKLLRGLGWFILESPKAEQLSLDEEKDKEKFDAALRRHYRQVSDQVKAGQSEEALIEAYRRDFRSGIGNARGYHCLISKIFGNPILPARIVVDDLICLLTQDELPEVLRPGVSINRRRRVAEDQKVFFLETSPANAQLEFIGQLQFLPGVPEQAKPLILAGLRHIHALGGSKSAGLGWLSWHIEGDADTSNFDWSQLLPPGGAL